ncbi:heptahelical transmembrane protein 2 [Andrographis paniculata]|uniref:heptahelical transmembrane protein 2 n=1 Tax=Andrographis paniculata TaxID=175694 RepID=UPI0021E7DB12|nr:heptahelical transmembrane protein 2 [Andrographis paniculata]
MKRRSPVRSSQLQEPAACGGGCDGGEEIRKWKRRTLVKYEALPDYLKDNEFIRKYYRCEWPLKDILLSVFSLHNETLNIWTHLVGFMIFTALMIMSLSETMSIENVMATLFGDRNDGLLNLKMMNQSNSSSAFFTGSYGEHIARSSTLLPAKPRDSIPIWPWLVFLGGAMSCLIFSSVSHLFACHSRRFNLFFWRLDYAGISLMIVCSFFAPIYYAFSNHPYWLVVYLSFITLLGILVVITLLSPSLSSSRFRFFRAALFLCMGFSGVIPATHATILYWDQSQILISVVYEIVMGLLYGIGAVFYVTRIPERWKPGAFDIVGHSHQIFHVFVVAAALVHCAATLNIMEWRRASTYLTQNLQAS